MSLAMRPVMGAIIQALHELLFTGQPKGNGSYVRTSVGPII